MNWFIGQRVVCVKDDWNAGPFGEGATMPVVGCVYTIRDIKSVLADGRCAFRFDEIINRRISFGNRLEPSFHERFFRPVVIPEADLAQFEAILRGVEKREPVEA